MEYYWETKEADTTHQEENEHKPNPILFQGSGGNYFRGQTTELKQNVNRQCTYALAEYEPIFMANLATFIFSIFETKPFTENQTIIDVELILVFNSSGLLAVNSIFVSSAQITGFAS